MGITNTGVTAQTSGSRALALQLIKVAADEAEAAHVHEAHETALYLLKGTLVVYHGDWLQEQTIVRPGEFFYLPAGAVHAFRCLDPAEPCLAVTARSDPNLREPAQPLPELTPLLEQMYRAA
jgi:uncharacterized RmlC-like cupin family protein